jgi:hypothetical protein
MENFVVLLIVGAAALWGTSRFLRKRKPTACASGCDGCSCADKPEPLVTLKRR